MSLTSLHKPCVITKRTSNFMKGGLGGQHKRESVSIIGFTIIQKFEDLLTEKRIKNKDKFIENLIMRAKHRKNSRKNKKNSLLDTKNMQKPSKKKNYHIPKNFHVHPKIQNTVIANCFRSKDSRKAKSNCTFIKSMTRKEKNHFVSQNNLFLRRNQSFYFNKTIMNNSRVNKSQNIGKSIRKKSISIANSAHSNLMDDNTPIDYHHNFTPMSLPKG